MGRYYEKLTSGAAPKSAAGGRVGKLADEKKKKAPSKKKAQPAKKSKKPVEENDDATPSDEEVPATPNKKLQGYFKEESTEVEDDEDESMRIEDGANDFGNDQEV